MLLRILLGPFKISNTGLSPSMAPLSRGFLYSSRSHIEVLQPRRDKSLWFRLFPFRSPLLRESHSLSFPPLTEMFHFSGYCSLMPMCSALSDWRLSQPGFPISDISGSKRACRSPKLIAACHVLLRLVSPRHSPKAPILQFHRVSG